MFQFGGFVANNLHPNINFSVALNCVPDAAQDVREIEC